MFIVALFVCNSTAQIKSLFTAQMPLITMQGCIDGSLLIASDKGFVIREQCRPFRKKWYKDTHLAITCCDGRMYINSKQVKADSVTIDSINGLFYFQHTCYAGSLLLHCHNKHWYLTLYTAPAYCKRLALNNYNWLSHLSKNSKLQDNEHKQEREGEAQRAFNVRVLLDERHQFQEDWKISSQKGFWLIDPSQPSQKLKCTKREVLLRVADGSLYINSKKLLLSQLHIVPRDGHLSFNDKIYQGSFLVQQQDRSTLLINILNLEDYIFSVLRWESWPGWPLEVNKVFAIASRSYIIAMMREARNNKRSYHVKDTNIHQTYNGVHNAGYLKDAVEQTRGIFLAYDKQPIVAMFDSCCGGIIPAGIEGINFDKAPYLAREYACTYCKNCKIYNWQATYAITDLEHHIKKEISHVKKIKNIQISKKDPAGTVQEVAIKSVGSSISLSGKKLYSLLKEIKSFCFSVSKQPGSVIFHGRGYGHHLGLCQWGARQMVRDGWDYKRILQFYYPTTNFMKLY